MYKIPFSQINKLFDKMAENSALYLPAAGNDTVAFKKYGDGVTYAPDALNTVRSAKDFFFPQVENIAKFKVSGKSIEIGEMPRNNEPYVVFGVRACDMRSFSILDSVFLSEPVDTYYKERREKAVIITAACNEPEETCFCTSFGIEPSEPQGDVSTWTDAAFLYWKSNTEKGDALTAKLSDILLPCEENEVDNIKQNINMIAEKLPLGKINLDYWQNTDEKTIFNSEKWDSLYKGCLGCGTCTFVCPTCQCYDVRDFDSGKGVIKFRCWDSCMYSDFTKMAHGNPRKTQKERFRQRFMHKLKYFPVSNDGVFSCVGCGRCLKSCPQSLNIVKVARSVSDD